MYILSLNVFVIWLLSLQSKMEDTADAGLDIGACPIAPGK